MIYAKFTATGDEVYKDLANGLGLMHMSNALHESFIKCNDPTHLDRAIQLCKQALTKLPPGNNHPRGMALHNLGKLLSLRYERFQTVKDLNRAIAITQLAVGVMDPDSPDRHSVLCNLAAIIGTRYRLSGGMENLSHAIKWAEDAVTATPANHAERPVRLSNFGILLMARNKETGSLADLVQALELAEVASAATDNAHPSRAFLLNNLGMIYERKHTVQGNRDDIDRAIAYVQEAVQLGGRNHPDHMHNLGMMVMARYKLFEGAEDLEFAIQCTGDAIAGMPVQYYNRPAALCHLGLMIVFRYRRFGMVTDLERAIELTQEGITATHAMNPELPDRLCNLGLLYHSRCEHFGAVNDLEKAIENMETANAACPATHQSKATILTNLASLLVQMYKRFKRPEHLVRAIVLCESAVLAIPETNPDRGEKLSNVAYILLQRFNQSNSMGDLDLAIGRAEEAILLVPAESVSFHRAHRLLGKLLFQRYKKLAEKESLVRAIKITEQCAVKVPPDHIQRSTVLLQLADMVNSRYRLLHTRQDFFYSLRLLYEAWYCHAAPPQARILAAGRAAAYLARSRMWQEASSLLADAFKMLQKVDMRSLSMSDQSYRLSEFLSPDATALLVSVSLNAGEEVSHCLRHLELARGLIIGYFIDYRSDLSELRLKHPQFADTFHRLRAAVDTPANEIGITSNTPLFSFQQGPRQRERLASDLEKTTEGIRALPGFERFHLPPTSEEIIEMAAYGPIIVVTSSDLRTDAIIVTRTAIKSISLTPLGPLVLEQMKSIANAVRGPRPTYTDRNCKMSEILGWLWDAIVEPVFDELDLKPVSNTRDLPRVWWIGIGCLSTAPFHAAGYNGPNSTRNTMSRAISSYIPTIKALKYTRQTELLLLTKTDPSIMVITMPTTPDDSWQDLPNATVEASQIESIVGGRASMTILNCPSASSVRAQLPAHDAIHFACHGLSDTKNPSNSSLLLHGADGKLDRLTVESVASMKMNQAQIAYLSACSTAENSSAELINESIFIASGFQLAGFSHVLATQWESNDEACRQVSGDFYKFLFDGKPSGGGGNDGGHRKVSASFHQAVTKLRRVHRRQPLKWASFIHTGA